MPSDRAKRIAHDIVEAFKDGTDEVPSIGLETTLENMIARALDEEREYVENAVRKPK